MKWFLLLILMVAVAFAAGLRIDLDVLADKLQKKHDRNVDTFIKLGIDPSQIDYKSKPWWTFKDEDSVIEKLRLQGWDPVKKISDLLETGEELKKKLGPGPGEIAESQAREAAMRAHLAQQRVEDQVRKIQS